MPFFLSVSPLSWLVCQNLPDFVARLHLVSFCTSILVERIVYTKGFVVARPPEPVKITRNIFLKAKDENRHPFGTPFAIWMSICLRMSYVSQVRFTLVYDFVRNCVLCTNTLTHSHAHTYSSVDKDTTIRCFRLYWSNVYTQYTGKAIRFISMWHVSSYVSHPNVFGVKGIVCECVHGCVCARIRALVYACRFESHNILMRTSVDSYIQTYIIFVVLRWRRAMCDDARWLVQINATALSCGPTECIQISRN